MTTPDVPAQPALTDLDLTLYDQGGGGSWSSLPMRVQVYEQVRSWISTGQLPPSSQLPTEVDLCEMFEVSRTVIREALILLEEDGIVIRRRGVGRFVATHQPELGLEQLRPIELLLPTSSVVRLDSGVEHPTSLVAEHLVVDESSEVMRWESLLETDDGPACLTEEWIAWPPSVGGAAGRLIVSSVESGSGAGRTMASLVWDCCGAGIGPSDCRITVTTTEERRAELLGVDEGEPLLAIVQVTHHLGHPLIVTKHLIRTDQNPLVVHQRRGGVGDN